MNRIKSLHEERPLVEVVLNGKKRCALLDTGASVGLISKDVRLTGSGRTITMVDASGDEREIDIVTDFVELSGRKVGQFCKADISGVQHSIRQNTGIWIDIIISYRQMGMLNLSISPADSEIIVND